MQPLPAAVANVGCDNIPRQPGRSRLAPGHDSALIAGQFEQSWWKLPCHGASVVPGTDKSGLRDLQERFSVLRHAETFVIMNLRS
jgi:hypothetical protein